MIWGKGFWSLIPFTMQMALIVITGTVVATAAPVRRFIDCWRGSPASNRSAVVFVAVTAMVTSWFNWGFSLVFSAVLVRAVARRLPSVDYRTLAACSLLGLGSVWAQGLSGSAALQMATPGMLPEGIREVVANGGGAGVTVAAGIIPLRDTIFLWQSLARGRDRDRGRGRPDLVYRTDRVAHQNGRRLGIDVEQRERRRRPVNGRLQDCAVRRESGWSISGG